MCQESIIKREINCKMMFFQSFSIVEVTSDVQTCFRYPGV